MGVEVSYGQKKLNNDGQNFNLIRIFAIIAHKNGNMQCKPETERPLFQPLLNPKEWKSFGTWWDPLEPEEGRGSADKTGGKDALC